MKNYYLTPGPSELYFTAADHVQEALRSDVCAISHRSGTFQNIFKHTVEQVKLMLNVPADYHVVFTGSATEIWERLLQNCVQQNSYHFVNGSFSQKFHEFAGLLGKNGISYEAPLGKGFDISQAVIGAEVEMICVTHNETSTGVSMPLADIYALRAAYPDKLLVVDAVSSVPYPDIDFTKIDSLYFSVQKGMGLPAGLGVWIFNDRCVEKAKQLKANKQSIGTYHTIPALLSNASKFQTPETPNVLGIYLLGKVAEDMNRKGIAVIRRETEFKAALIYNKLENHPFLSAFVDNKEHRSQTVVVADVKGKSADEVIASLKPHGIIVGKGYGDLKNSQIRIANFPTHSKELFLQLADLL